MKSKNRSVIFLCVCAAMLIQLVWLTFETNKQLLNLTNFLHDPSRPPPQIGSLLFYFAIVLVSCFAAIVFSSVGWTLSLLGIK